VGWERRSQRDGTTLKGALTAGFRRSTANPKDLPARPCRCAILLSESQSVTPDTRGFGSLDREGAAPFVHDSEQFNGVLIDTLKELKTDPVVKCRDRLVGIELKSWQEETLLQPADLIAY